MLARLQVRDADGGQECPPHQRETYFLLPGKSAAWRMGCSSSRWGGEREKGGAMIGQTRSPEAVPKVARTKSNGFGTLPNPQPWAGLLALDGLLRLAFRADQICQWLN